jgi:hypothetical protein
MGAAENLGKVLTALKNGQKYDLGLNEPDLTPGIVLGFDEQARSSKF